MDDLTRVIRLSDRELSMVLTLAALNLDPRTLRVAAKGTYSERYALVLEEYQERRKGL